MILPLLLFQDKSMVVFVEAAVLDDRLLAEYGDFSSIKERLMTFRAGTDDLTDKIDFIICLGGDGTLLHASSLFQVRLSCYSTLFALYQRLSETHCIYRMLF